MSEPQKTVFGMEIIKGNQMWTETQRKVSGSRRSHLQRCH